MMYKLESMNIELTTSCPLRCPQCYCYLEGGRHIDLETISSAIKQAAAIGIKHIEFSGGETMCYPHLYEVVRMTRESGIVPNIATSGWKFDDAALTKLVEAGVEGVHISLNGPTDEINALSRDGYQYAISALELLKRRKFPRTMINWVMHRNNADSFPQMVELAEKYDVNTVVVMAPKPTSKHELNTYPTKEQMISVSQMVKRYSGSVKLCVETCFSPMLALVSQNKFWGNTNRGIHNGCAAGRSTLSLNVNGQYSPCRHMEYFESFPTMEDYWSNSTILKSIREADNNRIGKCGECGLQPYCRPCMAYNSKVLHRVAVGDENCPIQEKTLAK